MNNHQFNEALKAKLIVCLGLKTTDADWKLLKGDVTVRISEKFALGARMPVRGLLVSVGALGVHRIVTYPIYAKSLTQKIEELDLRQDVSKILKRIQVVQEAIDQEKVKVEVDQKLATSDDKRRRDIEARFKACGFQAEVRVDHEHLVSVTLKDVEGVLYALEHPKAVNPF